MSMDKQYIIHGQIGYYKKHSASLEMRSVFGFMPGIRERHSKFFVKQLFFYINISKNLALFLK